MLDKKTQLILALQSQGIDLKDNLTVPATTFNELEKKYHYLIAGGHTKTEQTDGFTKQTHTKVNTPYGSYD